MRITLLAILLALGCVGCGGVSGDVTPLNGNWEVTAIDGKPIPTGVMVTVHYERGGEFNVATIGDGSLVQSLNRGAIQPAMDLQQTELKSPTLKLKGKGLDVELKKSKG